MRCHRLESGSLLLQTFPAFSGTSTLETLAVTEAGLGLQLINWSTVSKVDVPPNMRDMKRWDVTDLSLDPCFSKLLPLQRHINF
jgi:hypothetical protein